MKTFVEKEEERKRDVTFTEKEEERKRKVTFAEKEETFMEKEVTSYLRGEGSYELPSWRRELPS